MLVEIQDLAGTPCLSISDRFRVIIYLSLQDKDSRIVSSNSCKGSIFGSNTRKGNVGCIPNSVGTARCDFFI